MSLACLNGAKTGQWRQQRCMGARVLMAPAPCVPTISRAADHRHGSQTQGQARRQASRGTCSPIGLPGVVVQHWQAAQFVELCLWFADQRPAAQQVCWCCCRSPPPAAAAAACRRSPAPALPTPTCPNLSTQHRFRSEDDAGELSEDYAPSVGDDDSGSDYELEVRLRLTWLPQFARGFLGCS